MFSFLFLLVVWVSWERVLEEEKVVFPEDGLSQRPLEQSRFVNKCWDWGRGGPGMAFLLPM